MARVKFLGTLLLETKVREIGIDEKYLSDILKTIDRQYDNIHYRDLKNAIIFVNNQKCKKSLLKKIEINEKDVITIYFPLAGG